MTLLARDLQVFTWFRHVIDPNPMLGGQPTYPNAGTLFFANAQPVKAEFVPNEPGGRRRALFVFYTKDDVPAAPLDLIEGADGARYTVMTNEAWPSYRKITAEAVARRNRREC